MSTECKRKRRSVPAWPWICGVKPKPKAGNKPLSHSIVPGLDKPGVFTTVSKSIIILGKNLHKLLTTAGGHTQSFLVAQAPAYGRSAAGQQWPWQRTSVHGREGKGG